MIKAIIFDCFGVLSVDNWLPFKEEYFGHDQVLFDKSTELNDQANNGLITYDEFLQKIADLAKVDKALARRQIDNNPANTPLFEYIATDLKPHYKIGLLSNAAGNWLNDLFYSEQIALIDEIALSYQIGFVKPDPRAYQVMLDKLNVKPQESVLVDDQQRYCTAAREMGMEAVCYQDFRNFKTELEEILSHT